MKPFIIDTDSSQYALGGVCSQLNEEGIKTPVAYASRTLSKSERNYSATKREALGVFWAVHQAFHIYTYGAAFILRCADRNRPERGRAGRVHRPLRRDGATTCGVALSTL